MWSLEKTRALGHVELGEQVALSRNVICLAHVALSMSWSSLAALSDISHSAEMALGQCRRDWDCPLDIQGSGTASGRHPIFKMLVMCLEARDSTALLVADLPQLLIGPPECHEERFLSAELGISPEHRWVLSKDNISKVFVLWIVETKKWDMGARVVVQWVGHVCFACGLSVQPPTSHRVPLASQE